MSTKSFLPYAFLGSTILLTVYSQLMVKWRISTHFADIHLPKGIWEKFRYLFTVLFDPGIFSGLMAIGLSGLCWIATLAKLDISFAYPFTSLSFVLVLLLSSFLFGEELNLYKIIGILFIMTGIFISSHR